VHHRVAQRRAKDWNIDLQKNKTTNSRIELKRKRREPSGLRASRGLIAPESEREERGKKECEI
jgi:hypothetical protein